MEYKTLELIPEEVDEQIRGLLLKKYVAPDYLLLFQELFEVQYETEIKLRAEHLYPSISTEEADKRIEQGLPVLDPDKFQLDEAGLGDLLQKISSILAKHGGNGNSPGERLVEAERLGKVSLEELARKTIADDGEYFRQIAEKIGEDKEGIVFVATALVSPFLRVCAKHIRQKVNLDLVLSRRCPICGGAPLMAKLQREAGKKILECTLCNTQWAFKRLSCPFCGNEDQDTLGFFFIEEESAYRVDKCDRCKRYIKTVDERKKAEDELRALVLEDAATLYLDMLAEKEGYQRISKVLWKEGNI